MQGIKFSFSSNSFSRNALVKEEKEKREKEERKEEKRKCQTSGNVAGQGASKEDRTL